MRQLLILILLSISFTMSAQTQIPNGPPWTEVCKPMTDAGFSLIFTNTTCRADFESYYASNSADQIHIWMKDNATCFKEWAHFSWLALYQNDSKMAELSWIHQMHIAASRLADDQTCEDQVCYENKVSEILQNGVTGDIGPVAAGFTNAFLDQVELNESFKPQMDEAYNAVSPICLYHANFACINAMNSILDRMYPRSYALQENGRTEHMTFSMVDYYRDVFTDALIQRYASELALDLLAMVRNGQHYSQSETFYKIAMQAFQGDEERFWKFIIVYATRGAAWATGYKMVLDDNKPLFAAFMVVSAFMGLEDTHLISNGYAWSYLSNWETTCFQPKPYHYWMSAGFAYLLKKEGYNERTAILVSRLLGAMYEAGGSTQGRVPDDVFFVPPYDTPVNRVRRELTHQLLGSEFGVDPTLSTPQSFDDTFLRFLQSSSPLPAMTDEEIRQQIQDPPTRWRLWSDLTGFYLR